MKPVPPRLIVAACVLGGVGTPCLAGNRAVSSMFAPGLIVALLWMLLLGLGFHALLRRHLRMDARCADVQRQLGTERRARMLAERALGETHAELGALAAQQEQVRENERQRIARDIHDDLGQNLLALKIELSMMHVSSCGVHPLVTQKLGCMITSLDNTIKSLRAIINDLRPVALEAGLQNAVERQLNEFSRINGIRYQLNAGEHAFDSGPDHGIDAMLLRILQEALSNVVRHAHATEVKIELNRNGERLTLRVQDNGVGMAGPRSPDGCGLLGIKDRVRALGGSLAIDSQPGAGTLLSLTIPLLRRALAC